MHLFDKLENYSSNVAIIGDNQNSYTYKELLHSADILGEKISKRTTVFLVCKNSYEFMISYIALIQNKVVFFLINNSINKEKFKYLINHYKSINCMFVNSAIYSFLMLFDFV